jgi:hypothetical protein
MVTRKTPAARIACTAAFLVLALALVPVAFAGKGGKPGGGGGSTSGSYTVTVTPGGPYTYGQSIFVTTSVPESLSPFIWLRCYQNGVLVGSSDHAAFPGGWYYGWPFTLGGSMSWQSGAADCTVSIVHVAGTKVATDATASFHVNA